MSQFVKVPGPDIFEELKKAGFTEDQNQKGEVAYVRYYDNRRYIKVLTSVPKVADAARGCGQDAIRVMAMVQWTPKGGDDVRHATIKEDGKKCQWRVYRVTSIEGVLERMVKRMRDAWRACSRDARKLK